MPTLTYSSISFCSTSHYPRRPRPIARPFWASSSDVEPAAGPDVLRQGGRTVTGTVTPSAPPLRRASVTATIYHRCCGCGLLEVNLRASPCAAGCSSTGVDVLASSSVVCATTPSRPVGRVLMQKFGRWNGLSLVDPVSCYVYERGAAEVGGRGQWEEILGKNQFRGSHRSNMGCVR